MTRCFVPIHKHLLIKAVTTKPITEVIEAKIFLKDLVYFLGMKPVTEPQAVYVSDLGNEGLTGSINLATSHIAFHCWDTTGMLMIDVYSCKEFDHYPVMAFIDRHWNLSSYDLLVLDRADPNIYTIGVKS